MEKRIKKILIITLAVLAALIIGAIILFVVIIKYCADAGHSKSEKVVNYMVYCDEDSPYVSGKVCSKDEDIYYFIANNVYIYSEEDTKKLFETEETIRLITCNSDYLYYYGVYRQEDKISGRLNRYSFKNETIENVYEGTIEHLCLHNEDIIFSETNEENTNPHLFIIDEQGVIWNDIEDDSTWEQDKDKKEITREDYTIEYEREYNEQNETYLSDITIVASDGWTQTVYDYNRLENKYPDCVEICDGSEYRLRFCEHDFFRAYTSYGNRLTKDNNEIFSIDEEQGEIVGFSAIREEIYVLKEKKIYRYDFNGNKIEMLCDITSKNYDFVIYNGYLFVFNNDNINSVDIINLQ